MIPPIVVYKKPPAHIYDKCVELFGANFEKGTIFAYDGKIYARRMLPDDVIAHEMVHLRQQKEIGVENWWKKYFVDPKFRLEQEVEAYRSQYSYLQHHSNRNHRRMMVDHIVETLSGPIYGNLVSEEEALNLIKS